MTSPRPGGPLLPCPYRLGDHPPPPPAVDSPPLLLLIDRRAPLAPSLRSSLISFLSAAERQRHAALRQQDDRERYLVGRVALRDLLGHWLERPPAAVSIEIGPHGKPACAGAPAFNLSHSGDLILLAFHGGDEVGVDVEQARPNLDWRPIAERVLPPAEVSALGDLPGAEQAQAFLQAWCRLEARLKALGVGLAGLEGLRSGGSGGEDSGPTRIWDVAVPPGHAAAVALAAGGAGLKGPPAATAGAGRPNPRR
ncbi:MAG: 4'-phosphopantetheinyl transferase superfamily protein [Cyanobacteriota bacterium]|nr:4'-phosphopantetheinyl transferase superfamily protein [Cyanobacteriota bacterium]